MPLVSHAESGVGEGDITIETDPLVPVAGKSVTATLVSYSTDLNRAFIEWRDGSGRILSSGIGDTSYTATAGEPNSSIEIQVYITPAGDSSAVVKSFSIRPSDVDVLWQVDNSHTPPFYKGKALPTSESVIRAVAMPNAGSTSSTKSNITYVWKLENNTITKSSGAGKNPFIFKNSYLRNTENVSVNVSSVSGSYRAENSIRIPIVDPKLIFYLKDSFGVTNYGQALNDETQASLDESTLVAEPYFFALDDAGSDINYNWKINGNKISTPKNPRILTIRPSSTGGYATISLSMENITKLFQSVSGTLRLNFQ